MNRKAIVRNGDGEWSAGPKRNTTMRRWIICGSHRRRSWRG
jgi:hypothetical protein